MNMYWRLLRVLLLARRARPVTLWDSVRTPFRVRLSDLDPQRHMNNGIYLTIGDLGRIDLMIRAGFAGQMRRLGWFPVVASQTIRYRRSLTLGQRFELETSVLGTDGHSVFLSQRFLVRDDLYAESIVRARFLKKSGGSVSHVELVDVVGEFPDHLELPTWVAAWARESAGTS